MSTNGMIAIAGKHEGEFLGRYIHWDGDTAGQHVRKILERDGLEKATQVLLHEHYGWSSIDAVGIGVSRDVARWLMVEGYGEAYTHAEQDDVWLHSREASLHIEFAHVITAAGVASYAHKGDDWSPLPFLPIGA